MSPEYKKNGWIFRFDTLYIKYWKIRPAVLCVHEAGYFDACGSYRVYVCISKSLNPWDRKQKQENAVKDIANGGVIFF